jgi:hypothetical protein
MATTKTTCSSLCATSADDGCPKSEIRQGESLELKYTYDPPQDLTDFVCTVNVRVDNEGDPTDEELRITKTLTELSNDGMSYVGRLTSGETNLLIQGNYWIAGELNNSTTGQNQETVCQFEITQQYVFPDPSAVEEIVSAAEANPTPETQSTAQLAVNSLPAGSERDAFQVRVTALDPEVANVVDARLLVVAAETYPWTSTKQNSAQSAVNALVSPVERSNLSARLSALNDEVAATDAVNFAYVTRNQVDINTAQILINNIEPPENRVQLQAVLDSIQTFDGISIYSGSFSTVVNSYFISKTSLRVRNPNIDGSYRANFSLMQGAGWASIGVTSLMRQSFNTFFGVGDILFISEASIADQSNGAGNSILIGDFIFDDAVNIGATEDEIILAVDYRGANPIVYVIGASTLALLYTATLPITGTCSFGINTRAHSDNEREYFYEINVGSDLVNRPFAADAEQILIDALVDTTGYVEGWGQSQSLALTGAPTFVFTTPAPTPSIGVEFTIGASVVDANGIDRTSLIRWRNKFDNWLLNNNIINGAEISYTPTVAGSYEFVAEFEDETGNIYKINRTVIVSGAPSMAGNLAWDPAASYPTIAFNSDVPPFALNSIANNGAQFGTVDKFKKAAVGNIAIFGQYRYFELKLTNTEALDQFGVGLFSLLSGNVGWSGGDASDPQEGAGGVSILNANQFITFLSQPWINGSSLVYRGDGMNQGTILDSDFTTNGGIIGMAVDYRDTNNAPIVHVIHSSLGVPVWGYSFRLWNCRTPIRPQTYVNDVSQNLVSDVSINGQEANMTYDPITILGNAGIDITGLVPYWGDADAI